MRGCTCFSLRKNRFSNYFALITLSGDVAFRNGELFSYSTFVSASKVSITYLRRLLSWITDLQFSESAVGPNAPYIIKGKVERF